MVTIANSASVYLDANSLIYITEGTAAFKKSIGAFLRTALAANARLVTSELAITEVLVHPLRENSQRLIDAYNELFDQFVQAVPIDRSILVRAAELRAAASKLRTPDAIHIATAESLQAQVFVTGDRGIAVSPPMVRHIIG